MRIALLGTVGPDLTTLEPVLQHAVTTLQADAVFYIGAEPEVHAWVRERQAQLKTPESEALLWARAEHATTQPRAELNALVLEERRRHVWDRLELLPDPPRRRLRSPSGQAWLLCFDPGEALDADVEAADVIASGKRPDWMVEVDNDRAQLAPGAFSTGGLMLIDDDVELRCEIYDSSQALIATRSLTVPRAEPRAAG